MANRSHDFHWKALRILYDRLYSLGIRISVRTKSIIFAQRQVYVVPVFHLISIEITAA
jgi:hypothetical protein